MCLCPPWTPRGMINGREGVIFALMKVKLKLSEFIYLVFWRWLSFCDVRLVTFLGHFLLHLRRTQSLHRTTFFQRAPSEAHPRRELQRCSLFDENNHEHCKIGNFPGFKLKNSVRTRFFFLILRPNIIFSCACKRNKKRKKSQISIFFQFKIGNLSI